MEEEVYWQADRASLNVDPQAAYKRAQAEAAQRAQLSGRAQGAFLGNATSPAQGPMGMTERIGNRLASIGATLNRAHNTLSEKHISQFGFPAPSGVTELRKGQTGEAGPSNAEAQIFAILDMLSDRASDVEAAAESLTNRL